MLPLAAQLSRAHLKSRLPGKTKITRLLAKYVPSLHSFPINFEDRPPVYMDLRVPGTQFWLEGSPWKTSPWEPGEQEVIRRFVKPRSVVYDIGAHLGIHTTLFSTIASEVHAFEPNPALRKLLSKTATKNVIVHPCALSDASGEAEFFVPPEHDSTGSLRPWHGSKFGVVNSFKCDVKCLDDLNLPKPSFIKIDVEGAELSVFRGARQILESGPTILFEANREASASFGESVNDASDFLRSLGYDIFTVNDDGQLVHETPDASFWNLLALRNKSL